MKILFSLLIMSFSSIVLTAHDVPIAVFHVYEVDAIIKIDITFDLDDFMTSLELDRKEVNLENIQDYLEKHTSFEFNDKTLILSLATVNIATGHIEVKGSLGQVTSEIKTIEISNTCLNNVSQHSNVIQLDMNNLSRDYRMHKDRTYIKLAY